MQTIDSEAKQRARHPLNFDNMGEKYKTSNGHFAFTSPSLWVLEKNLFYLLKNSVQKEFESKYKWKPDYLAFDEYNSVLFAPYLMYINGVMLAEEFDLINVIIPNKSDLINITRDKIITERKDMSEVEW